MRCHDLDRVKIKSHLEESIFGLWYLSPMISTTLLMADSMVGPVFQARDGLVSLGSRYSISANIDLGSNTIKELA
jgi:hypothetical protein